MAWLKERYEERLEAVKAQIASLKELEEELGTSLKFLAGCAGCGEEASPKDACSGCMRNERKGEGSAQFVMGLTAH